MIAPAAQSRRSELPAAAAVGRLLAAAVAPVLAAGLLVACAGAPSPRQAPASGVGFLISQRDSLYDVPLDIRVTGLRPGERVTVGLSATNEVGSRWSARATFVARGRVLDLGATAPVAGSYRGAAGMGLFESMRNRRFDSYFGPRNPQPFTLTAVIRGRLAATATLVRELTSAGVRCVQQTVATAGFFGSYCAPARRAARRPAVLIFGGSEGGLAVADLAGLLASHGYPALALAYFGAPGLPANLVRIPLEYFARAARWLRRMAGVTPASAASASAASASTSPGAGSASASPGAAAGRPGGTGSRPLVAWGFSRGSEAALLLGVHFPGLVSAVIAGSPSSVTNVAFSSSSALPPDEPAWTLGGRALPVASPPGDPRSAGNPAAVIPVARIRGPLLLLAGADDQLWPSPGYARAIMTALAAHHDPYLHQLKEFAGAGHVAGFAMPYDAGPARIAEGRDILNVGGTPVVNSAAETGAWRDALAFLGRLG
jgi:dienelactone hydrolase